MHTQGLVLKLIVILNHEIFTNLPNKNLHVSFLQAWNWVQHHQNFQSDGETVEEKNYLKDRAQYCDQMPDGIIAGYLENTLRTDSLH